MLIISIMIYTNKYNALILYSYLINDNLVRFLKSIKYRRLAEIISLYVLMLRHIFFLRCNYFVLPLFII